MRLSSWVAALQPSFSRISNCHHYKLWSRIGKQKRSHNDQVATKEKWGCDLLRSQLRSAVIGLISERHDYHITLTMSQPPAPGFGRGAVIDTICWLWRFDWWFSVGSYKRNQSVQGGGGDRGESGLVAGGGGMRVRSIARSGLHLRLPPARH